MGKTSILKSALKIIVIGVFFLGCERRYRLSEYEVMKVYNSGYTWGYHAAKQQAKKFKIINDSTIVFDYSNYDTCRIIDSVEKSKLLFE